MQEYIVVINGIEHTMQLSDADAKARDAKPVSSKVVKPTTVEDKAVKRAASKKS